MTRLAATTRRLAPAVALLLLAAPGLLAHGVSASDRAFMEKGGLAAFAYLGAKHMVTGYDHLLFLLGVIFFLHRLKDVAVYVTLFAVGHSTTLIYGVMAGTAVDAYLIDAVIGLSVVYKALDNLGAWRRWFGVQPEARLAVLAFGFVHGFGLATKIQDFALPRQGLLTSLVSFNLGVEAGQLLALAAMLISMAWWRRRPSFERHAFAANWTLMVCGFALAGFQLAGYALS